MIFALRASIPAFSSAEIWLSMAREIYIEEGRRIKTLDEGGEPDSVELGAKKAIDPNTGEVVSEADLSRADFDVWVDVGPSSASRRATSSIWGLRPRFSCATITTGRSASPLAAGRAT